LSADGFDKISSSYKSILDNDVKMSGEDADYFALYKAQCVKRVLGPGFNGRILDFGSGIGLTARSLKYIFDDNPSVEISGFDVSEGSINISSQRIKGAHFTSDFGSLAKNSFDCVIMANVMHHVKPPDRNRVLSDALSVLKNGGMVIIFEHNPYNPLTRMVVRSSPIDKDAELVAPKKMSALLTECNISVSVKYIVFFPKFLKALRILERVLGELPLGAQYMCYGRKTGHNG